MQLCQIILLILIHFFFGKVHGFPQLVYVVSVDKPTYNQEYRCVTEPDVENTKYSWYRQGWSGLPHGVKAEGDRLHFLNETPELNGVYICTIANQNGEAAGSLYHHRKRIYSEL